MAMLLAIAMFNPTHSKLLKVILKSVISKSDIPGNPWCFHWLFLWVFMDFLWKTMVFLWFFYGFPMKNHGFSMDFLWKTMVFLGFFYGFPMKNHGFSMGFLWISYEKPWFFYGFSWISYEQPWFFYGFSWISYEKPWFFYGFSYGFLNPTALWTSSKRVDLRGDRRPPLWGHREVSLIWAPWQRWTKIPAVQEIYVV